MSAETTAAESGSSRTWLQPAAVVLAGILIIVLFLLQFRVTPLTRFPGWDLFWADTLVAGKLDHIQRSVRAGELPAFDINASLGYNAAGEAKALTSYFSPLLPFMLALEPEQFMQLRFGLFLLCGFVGTFYLVRFLEGSSGLAVAGAALYVLLPPHFSNEQYYFSQSFFLLPLVCLFQLSWTKSGGYPALFLLGLTSATAYSASDIYFLLILPPMAFFPSLAWAAGKGVSKAAWLRLVGGLLMVVGVAAFYIFPLLWNLWEIRYLRAELAAVGAAQSPSLSTVSGFWDFFSQAGIPSFFLPQQSSAMFFYLPAALPLLALFLSVPNRCWAKRPIASFHTGTLFTALLMVAGSFLFYSLPESFTNAARGTLRYQINLWPYAILLAVLAGLAQCKRAALLRRTVVLAFAAGLVIDFFLFVPERPSAVSSVVADWFQVKHAIRTTVESVNRLRPPDGVDLWFWLPGINLSIGLVLLASLASRRSTPHLLAWPKAAAAVLVGFLYLTIHSELRNRQQAGWQILGRSDFHLSAFRQRRTALLERIPPADRLNYRILPCSADVFQMHRGRNWKLLAETELLSHDDLKVLFPYRELEHPFVGALYSSFYPTFATSNFFPPLVEQVDNRISRLRPLGVRYVIAADGRLTSSELELLAEIHTQPPPFYETAADGMVFLYQLKQALPLVWLDSSTDTLSNSEYLRLQLEQPDAFAALFTLAARDVSQASVVSQTPSSFTVRTTSERPQNLVVSFAYRRFWTATVNGGKVPVDRSHGSFMRIAIPPGQNTVEWRYVPLDAITGMIVSLLFLAVPLAIPAWTRIRKMMPLQNPPAGPAQSLP